MLVTLFLDPYGISSLPRREPDGAYMDHKDPERAYTDSIRKSQQSLPSMVMTKRLLIY